MLIKMLFFLIAVYLMASSVFMFVSLLKIAGASMSAIRKKYYLGWQTMIVGCLMVAIIFGYIETGDSIFGLPYTAHWLGLFVAFVLTITMQILSAVRPDGDLLHFRRVVLNNLDLGCTSTYSAYNQAVSYMDYSWLYRPFLWLMWPILRW